MAEALALLIRKFTFVKPIRHVVVLQSLPPKAVRDQRSVTDRLSVHKNPGDPCKPVGEMKFSFLSETECYRNHRVGFFMEKGGPGRAVSWPS
jgi:hypothetical protein